MKRQRYLYHGTSTKHLHSILTNGIQPRSITGVSNWEKYKSREDLVYLTAAYPWYFALNSALDEKYDAVVFQIDMNRLDSKAMYPDEDWIAQEVSRARNVTLESVHESLRDRLDGYKDYWKMCLQSMGTCSHKGTIPADAIVQYVTFDIKKRPEITMSISDPAITALNYAVKGWFYRQLVDWTFKRVDDLPQVTEQEQYIKAGIEMPHLRQSLRMWRVESQKREGFLVYPNESYRTKKEVLVGKV